MRKKKRKKECVHYIHMYNVFGNKLDDRPSPHKILNKRRINGLVYRTQTSIIFIGPGLLGF